MPGGFTIGVGGIRNSASFKCWLCERYWPFKDEYEWCPACEEQCEGSPKTAMPEDEAVKIATEYQFGWWLWRTNSL